MWSRFKQFWRSLTGPQTGVRPPNVGEDIYIPTELYLLYVDEGTPRDDVKGGLARVKKVMKGIGCRGRKVTYISVEEVNGLFDWDRRLAPVQETLKSKFGLERAHPNPNFNSRQLTA